MDMQISGSGNIPAGEYENIRISGSGSLYGHVKCTSLRVSGSSHGESIVCSQDIRISGSTHMEKDVQAADLHVSGSLNCGGNLTVQNEISLSGGMHCEKNIKCGTLYVSGGITANANIEAETATINGGICCDGLLNAEQIQIKLEGVGKSSIGSIGCSRLSVEKRKIKKLFGRRKKGILSVKNDIEGDEIYVEYVTCPRVSGRTVKVGKGCEIELLQYSDSYEIHEKAKIGRIEKI